MRIQSDESANAVKPIAMTVSAAVRYTSIGRSKLYQYINAGLLPVVKVGRSTRIKTTDLEALIDRLGEEQGGL